MAKKQLKEVGSDLIKTNAVVGLGGKALDFGEKVVDCATTISENNKEKKIAQINKEAEIEKEFISKLETKEERDEYMDRKERIIKEKSKDELKKTGLICGTIITATATIVGGTVYLVHKLKHPFGGNKNNTTNQINDCSDFFNNESIVDINKDDYIN